MTATTSGSVSLPEAVRTLLKGDGRQGMAVGGGGCDLEGARTGDLWFTGGGGSDREVLHGGRVPDGATEVRLFFGDEPPVVTEVQEDGYFFVVLPHGVGGEYGYPDRLEALGPDGAVVDSTTRP